MSPQPIRIEGQQPDPESEYAPTEAELDQLRRLVLGYDDEKLDDLQGWLNDPGHRAAEVSKVLPRAIRLRAGDDPQLGEALAPVVESAFADLVRRNPDAAARMIAPVIGPAIREAIAGALRRPLRSLRLAATLPGLRWWWEARRCGETYSAVADRHTLVYRVDHLILFHRASGQCLVEVSNPDAAAVVGDDLVEEIARMRDLIRGDASATVPRSPRPASYSIAIEQSPRLLLAAVVSGNAPELLQDRMLAVLDAIEVERRLALKAFIGDTSPFELCKPMLERCLDAEYRDPPARNAARFGLAVLGAAAVAAAWWAFA